LPNRSAQYNAVDFLVNSRYPCAILDGIICATMLSYRRLLEALCQAYVGNEVVLGAAQHAATQQQT